MKPKLMLLVMFSAIVSYSCVSNSRGFLVENGVPGEFSPITLTRTVLVAGGKCLATLKYDEKSGDLIKVEKIIKVEKVETDFGCFVGQGPLSVNGQELRDFSGPITFGSGTTTCYPTKPPLCICTKRPCP